MQAFWNTVAKYPVLIAATFFNLFLAATKPLLPLFKNPVTAIALGGAVFGGFAFLTFTLRAMLGLQAM